jgi:hypothetical protein
MLAYRLSQRFGVFASEMRLSLEELIEFKESLGNSKQVMTQFLVILIINYFNSNDAFCRERLILWFEFIFC